MRRPFMVRLLAALLTLTLAVPVASAQSDAERDAVRRAALDYLEGFYEGDSTKHVRSIHPSVYKYGFMYLPNQSRYNGSQMTWDGFMSYSRRIRETGRGTAPAGAPKEVVIYEVLDQTASAKVTAFWGIDYLLLAKFDGKWMITHVLWQTPARP